MAKLKNQLKQELKEAQQELAQVVELLEEKPDFGLGTGSTGSFTWEMNLARRERIEERIAELEEALERADEGSYGVCESCGKVIDPERLEIVPTATQCIECARQGVPAG